MVLSRRLGEAVARLSLSSMVYAEGLDFFLLQGT